jgi:hypothetical protein
MASRPLLQPHRRDAGATGFLINFSDSRQIDENFSQDRFFLKLIADR